MEKRQPFHGLIAPRGKRKSLRALITLLLSCALFDLGVARAEFGSIVDVGLASDLYFTDNSANNGQGYINLLMQNSWSDSQIWIDVGAGGLVGDTASTYLKAPQIYYKVGDNDSVTIVFGRHLHEWSNGDSFWNLGLTQPNFNWNQARPEHQGLTGFFLKIPFLQKKLVATFLLSGLYLPTQGPSFELINGDLSSSNPWFSVDVDEILFLGNPRDLRYEIDTPKAQDVIFKNTYALQIATPRNQRGLLFNSFVMDKPRNDLVLPFDIDIVGSAGADLVVRPVVARHQVAGLDLGWNSENYKLVASWLYESEVELTAPAGTIFPVYPEQNIFSLMQLFRLSQSQRVWLGYVHVEGADIQVAGPVPANTSISAFNNRNRFEQALRLKWEGLLFKTMSRYRVNASVAYNQSLIRDNVWLSSDVRWSVYRGFEAFWQCDFFGGSEQQIQQLDFMSTFQNNDRCLVGGHYAF